MEAVEGMIDMMTGDMPSTMTGHTKTTLVMTGMATQEDPVMTVIMIAATLEIIEAVTCLFSLLVNYLPVFLAALCSTSSQAEQFVGNCLARKIRAFVRLLTFSFLTTIMPLETDLR